MSATSFDSGPSAPRSEGPLGPSAPRSEGPLGPSAPRSEGPLGPSAPRFEVGLLARAAIAAIAVYQVARAGRPSPCRFWPSCSQYAREAIESHGVWRGGYLAARRVGRCRPGGGHGVDLVPDRLPRAGEAS